MTVNALGSSYLQSLYGGLPSPTGSPAASSFSLTAPHARSTNLTATATPVDSVANLMDADPVHYHHSRLGSVLGKLQQTDPALAQKLQGFQDQIQGMESSGQLQSAIASTIQTDIGSLSAQQKSEIQQAAPSIIPHHNHRGGGMDALMNALGNPASTSSAASDSSAATGQTASTNVVSNLNSAVASFFGQGNAQSQGLASYLQSQMGAPDQSLFGVAA